MPEKVAKRFKVYGVVQGVSFRYYAQKMADSLGISGWIRNSSDGSVEGFVEGEKEAVNLFLNWCNRGSPMAKVENVIVEEAEFCGLRGFEIKY